MEQDRDTATLYLVFKHLTNQTFDKLFWLQRETIPRSFSFASFLR